MFLQKGKKEAREKGQTESQERGEKDTRGPIAIAPRRRNFSSRVGKTRSLGLNKRSRQERSKRDASRGKVSVLLSKCIIHNFNKSSLDAIGHVRLINIGREISQADARKTTFHRRNDHRFLLLLLPVCDVQGHRSGVHRDGAVAGPYGSRVVDSLQGERNEMGMFGRSSSMLNCGPQLRPKNAAKRVVELVVRI